MMTVLVGRVGRWKTHQEVRQKARSQRSSSNWSRSHCRLQGNDVCRQGQLPGNAAAQQLLLQEWIGSVVLSWKMVPKNISSEGAQDDDNVFFCGVAAHP